jgi:hypothetical protein
MVSLTDFKLPSQGQHERVFLQDAIKKYKTHLLTAAGYIDTICRIYRAEGHRLNIPRPRQFYEYFEIPKSTFYRALIQLEKNPEIGFHWEPAGGISIWWEKPAAASVEPAAASVEPVAASVEPAAASVEPVAASVEPVAASVEPVAASVEPAAASVEPAPQRFNQIPADARKDFEHFVRSQWQKIRGEEIRSFHTFMNQATHFKKWWEKFNSQPKSNIQPFISDIIQPKEAISEPLSAEKLRQLRQLITCK